MDISFILRVKIYCFVYLWLSLLLKFIQVLAIRSEFELAPVSL